MSVISCITPQALLKGLDFTRDVKSGSFDFQSSPGKTLNNNVIVPL